MNTQLNPDNGHLTRQHLANILCFSVCIKNDTQIIASFFPVETGELTQHNTTCISALVYICIHCMSLIHALAH